MVIVVVLQVLGLALIVAGVALLDVPAALIVAGLALVLITERQVRT